jgi:hypothetical protein
MSILEAERQNDARHPQTCLCAYEPEKKDRRPTDTADDTAEGLDRDDAARYVEVFRGRKM